MAYDPTMPIISTGDSTPKEKVNVVKKLEYDFGTFVVEEINMDTVWPAGDPCPRDKETLVIFLERKSKPVESGPVI